MTGKILDVAIDCAQTWNLIATLKNIQDKRGIGAITKNLNV